MVRNLHIILFCIKYLKDRGKNPKTPNLVVWGWLLGWVFLLVLFVCFGVFVLVFVCLSPVYFCLFLVSLGFF